MDAREAIYDIINSEYRDENGMFSGIVSALLVDPTTENDLFEFDEFVMDSQII